MLETRKVFIDAQYFVKSGLHFDYPALKAFRKYCEESELFHVSTSVVKREVESKIKLSVDEALGALRNFRRKARIISSLDNEIIRGLFTVVPEEEVHPMAVQVFNEFLEACKTEVVDADVVDGEELLGLYFGKKPPFGDGKKKSEFPDAISFLSLKMHLKKEEKIYIVSDDGDLKSFCDVNENFISIDTLDKLLDIYNNHTNTRHQQVRQYFIDNEQSIKEKIKDYLENCDVYNLSTWEDAEVDGKLRVVDVGEIDPSVIYIDDEESQVTFEVDVDFEVTVVGPDFNNGMYDREEDRLYTFGSTSRTSTIEATFTVEIFLHYEFVDGTLQKAEDVDLFIAGTSGGIEVSVDENEIDW